jgi:hypothetical protein
MGILGTIPREVTLLSTSTTRLSRVVALLLFMRRIFLATVPAKRALTSDVAFFATICANIILELVQTVAFGMAFLAAAILATRSSLILNQVRVHQDEGLL